MGCLLAVLLMAAVSFFSLHRDISAIALPILSDVWNSGHRKIPPFCTSNAPPWALHPAPPFTPFGPPPAMVSTTPLREGELNRYAEAQSKKLGIKAQKID